MATKDVEKAGGEVREAYPVLFGESNMTAVIKENFGDDGIRPLDLEQITVPAGGGTTWEVPTLDGLRGERELAGIVVAWRAPRVYWSTKPDDREGGTTPPDCSSTDGKFGTGEYGRGSEGNPSGRCDSCPMNEWGSQGTLQGDNSRGKACRERRQLFMLLPGSVLPVVVNLPPTSIQDVRKYFLRLSSNGRPFFSVVTKLTLEKISKGGQNYSVVHAGAGDLLDDGAIVQARAFNQEMEAVLASATTRSVAPDDDE